MDNVYRLYKPLRLPMAEGMPDDVSAELDDALTRAFPRRLRVDNGRDSTKAVWLDYGSHTVSLMDDDVVSYREIVGWIRVDGRRVGMIKLNDWTAQPWVTDQSFYDALDAWTAEAGSFAWALASAWPVRSVMAQGGVLELARLWMAPEFARNSLWALAVAKFIRRYAGKRALLLVDAYPAYRGVEGLNRDLPWHEKRYQRRRRALVRLIARKLGTRPFPKGCPPDDFENEQMWQWLPLRPDALKPRRRKVKSES